jgi:ubiquinone/menaquinone biosynthesis C-methylase UbiE
MRRSWNHNTYYHRALLRRLPRRATRALDVGCGDGQFARLLACHVADVVAIDVGAEQVDRARRAAGAQHVQWECDDLLQMEAAAGSFDAVVANFVLQRLFGKTRMGSPAKDPDMSLREVRRRAAELLPGVKVRRRLFWRYILEWDKPAS